MTVTRGFMLALILVVAVPAAAQSRGSQRRPDPPRNNQPASRFDERDSRAVRDRRAVPRFDLAFLNGDEDGYEAGLKDRRRGDRFDPIREKRYRSADHGYDRRYGPKDLYKNRYREGFRRGYQEGYRDAAYRDGYNGRRDRRDPIWWWPFGR